MMRWMLIALLLAGGDALAGEVGINLAAVSYYSSEYPFVDVFRNSQPLMSQKRGAEYGRGGPIDLREDGYPKKLAEGQSVDAIVMANNPHYPGGKYVCLYKGKGRIRFKLDGKVMKSEPGRLEVQATPSRSGMMLVIEQTDENDPIHDVRVMRAEFEKTHEKEPFDPTFLKTWSGMKVLRFMNMMRTNGSQVREWSDRPKAVYQTQGTQKGVALELMIDLANKLGSDAWFCIPHLASDEYVREFARLIKARLDPRRKVYVEYSNETWNRSFAQAVYCITKGMELKLSNNDRQAGLRYQAQRSLEIFAIFEEVFGGKERLVRVLGVQFANEWGSDQVVGWKDAPRRADALAVAPYFAMPVNDRSAQAVVGMSVEQILDATRTELLKNEATLKRQVERARRHGLKLVSYEGGQHLVGVGAVSNDMLIVAKLHAANRHPRMYELYHEHYRQWVNAGGGLHVFFESAKTPAKSGSWGLQEYEGQPLESAHKLRAVREMVEGK